MLFIGLTFALQLWFAKNAGRAANQLLALALMIMTLWMIRILAIDIHLNVYFPHWDWLPMQFLLALGPLIYFYVLKITRPEYKLGWSDLLHFSPLLLEEGILVWEVKESIRTGAATYVTAAFQLLNPLLQLLIFISITAYLYRANKLIESFYRRLQPVMMDRSILEFRWLRRLLTATSLLGLLWTIYAAIDYLGYHNQLEIYVYYPFYIFFVLFLIWIAATTFLKPQAAMIVQTSVVPRLSPSHELREKGVWLKKAMNANRYYREPELSLTLLAGKLGLTSHELSRIINIALKKSFNDFINEYRVREVTSKMQNPAYDHITLLGIAYESGFNSQTSFTRILKQMTGKSPLEYKNSLKKEYPLYNLDSERGFATIILNKETTPKWCHQKLNRNFMIRNYFKTAWRSLLRNKVFSGLNIFGLATGMACSIIIFLWVQDELSFDRFNPHAEKIFRVTDKSGDQEYAAAPPSLAYAIKTQIPAIKNATRITAIQKMITIGTKRFNQKNIFYADSSFLQIFNYPLLKGNAANVLSSPYSVVLTETTAKRYFGSVEAAMGKTLYIDNDIKGSNLLVTGILKDIPANSHLQPALLIPMELYDKINNIKYGWTNFDVYVYFQLKDAFTPNPSLMSNIGRQIDELYKRNNHEFKASFSAQPLTDIHLHSHYIGDVPGQGSAQYVTIFSITAIFIILIACINFMNLATAISGHRAREVGLRKTLGALRMQLVAQFIGESLLLSFLALLLAILLVYFLLPLFNQLAAKTFSFNPFRINILLTLVGITLFTGILSGSYPAFFLASFNPVKALKGMQILRSNKSFFRNGLVVLQFSISIILIVSTLVIYTQVQFIQNRDIGFDKENLLYMQMPQVGDLKNNKDAMQAALASYPDVNSYTFTDRLPTDLNDGASLLQWSGMDPTVQVEAYRLRVDQNFAGTFGIKMVAGRFFSRDFAGDDSSFVVNEAALKVMQLKPNEAIGKSITFWDDKAPIIGVVKDFNFKSVLHTIEPLIMKSNFSGGYVVMRTRAGTTRKVIKAFQKSFHNVYGDYPFSYGFVNEDIDKLYVDQQRMGKFFNVFSVLSIIISCLGLFGLATFAAQQRNKEIGIRKVLGASVSGIVGMLSMDFIKLVFISILLASPIAWLAMDKWLQGFAYRIDISWWIVAVAGLTALLIAFITISFQSIRAATSNPIQGLRSE